LVFQYFSLKKIKYHFSQGTLNEYFFFVQISTPNFSESCRASNLKFKSPHLSLADDDLLKRNLKINSLRICGIKFFEMTDFSHGTLVMGRAINSTICHMLVLYFSHHGLNLTVFYDFFHHISRWL
jgi:hypothetical protein